MVLQKILKSDHILSGRVLPNALFELRRNYQINSLALHLPNLPLGNLLVYRSQKGPQSLCAFRDDLAPSLSQCSFGRKNYRVLSILLVQANGWKDKVWIASMAGCDWKGYWSLLNNSSSTTSKALPARDRRL